MNARERARAFGHVFHGEPGAVAPGFIDCGDGDVAEHQGQIRDGEPGAVKGHVVHQLDAARISDGPAQDSPVGGARIEAGAE